MTPRTIRNVALTAFMLVSVLISYLFVDVLIRLGLRPTHAFIVDATAFCLLFMSDIGELVANTVSDLFIDCAERLAKWWDRR